MSVEGRCRERNPADLAIFGAEADRFADRFADPSAGQALFARAVSEGCAEALAALSTPIGPRDFRVSLWRQRGGERIRLLAAFAGEAEASAPETRRAVPTPATAGLLAEALHAPIRAVLRRAETLRAGLDGEPPVDQRAVADITLAGWRLLRLADDLVAPPPGRIGPRAVAEIDLPRLMRRLLRLVADEIAQFGAQIVSRNLPRDGDGPAVFADESLLWSAAEGLILDAGRRAGRGGTITLSLSASQGGGAVLELRADRGGDPLASDAAAPDPNAHGRLLGPTACRALLEATGLGLDLAAAGQAVHLARILVPPARVLPVLAE